MPLIRANDYNILVAGSDDGTISTTVPNLGIVWGPGFGRYGYGQDVSYITPAQFGEVIEAQSWENINDILKFVAGHQGVTYDALPNNTFAKDKLITKEPQTTLQTGVDAVYQTVGQVYGNSDQAPVQTEYVGIWGDSGNRSLTFTHTINFESADKARYFFNLGGKIKMTFSRAGDVSNSRNTFWTGLCSAAGTIEFGYRNTKRLGGNSTAAYIALNNNNGGFWNLSNTDVEHLRTFSPNDGYYEYNGEGDYNSYYGYYGYNNTNDYIKVDGRISGVTGSLGGIGKTITLTTTFKNGTVVVPSAADKVSGTTAVLLTVSRPGLSYIENSWGFIDISSSVQNS